MLLTELPDDILFKLLLFLSPIDILSLRKSCKRFHSVTLERTVWINAYKNPEQFLPPGPSLRSSVHELERLLIRAYKLDSNWSNVAIKRNWSFKCKVGNGDIRRMELYKGRYLALGGPAAFFVYDISTQREIFSHIESRKTFTYWFYRRCGSLDVDYEETDFYIPVGKLSRFPSTLILALWKIEPSGLATMIEVLDVQIFNSQIYIGYGYCVCTHRSGYPILYHIESRKVYTFAQEEGLSRNRLTDVVIMADHVLLVYSQYTMDFREDKFLDLYPLPGLGMAEEDTILQRTHTGITSWSFNEVTCISSDIDTDCNTGTIWLTAIFNDRGLRAMCITLNADRNMTFHLAEDQCQYPDQYISHVLSYPYDSVLTVVPGSRARGVARTASLPGRPMLALYNLYREPNGNMAIDASCIWVPQLPLADSYTFDGFSGLLCIAASNQVDVLEFE